MPEEDITTVFVSPGSYQWTNEVGRKDEYITAEYDMADGTYSLTYHPQVCPVTTPCFTGMHAAIALRDAGYSYPQICVMLDGARADARKIG